MRIGEGLLTNGAAASEVTATVLRVTSSSGLRNVSAQVTFNEVTISYLADESATPFTRVRSASDRVQDFARLAAFEDISTATSPGSCRWTRRADKPVRSRSASRSTGSRWWSPASA